jgi:hypothetical protein
MTKSNRASGLVESFRMENLAEFIEKTRTLEGARVRSRETLL